MTSIVPWDETENGDYGAGGGEGRRLEALGRRRRRG